MPSGDDARASGEENFLLVDFGKGDARSCGVHRFSLLVIKAAPHVKHFQARCDDAREIIKRFLF